MPIKINALDQRYLEQRMYYEDKITAISNELFSAKKDKENYKIKLISLTKKLEQSENRVKLAEYELADEKALSITENYSYFPKTFHSDILSSSSFENTTDTEIFSTGKNANDKTMDKTMDKNDRSDKNDLCLLPLPITDSQHDMSAAV